MILAIDPGSEKTGMAVIHADGSLAVKMIVPTETMEQQLADVCSQYHISHIVMGDGTNHKRLQSVVEHWLKRENRQAVFSLVNEKYTTVEGRKLYFKYTPRRGWRRIVPLFLQYPPEPVDDFVAWIIGLRYIRSSKEVLRD